MKPFMKRWHRSLVRIMRRYALCESPTRSAWNVCSFPSVALRCSEAGLESLSSDNPAPCSSIKPATYCPFNCVHRCEEKLAMSTAGLDLDRMLDVAWVRSQFPSLEMEVDGQTAAFL